MPMKTKNLPLVAGLVRLCLPALFCLLVLTGQARPVQAAEAEPEASALAAAVEPGAKVLVLPFTCYILPSEYQDAQEAVLQSLGSNLVYALQQQGLRAQLESDGLEAGPPLQADADSPADVYLPLTPESSLSKDEQGELKAEPKRAGQWEDEAPNSHMLAGVPPQLDDSDIVPSGTLLLEPRAESAASGRGTSLEAEGEAEREAVVSESSGQVSGPGPESGLENQALGNEVIAQVMEESGILDKAARAGFDYILTGSVSFIQAELKPAVYAGKREVTSVRTAFSCSYRLLSTQDGKVAAFGSSSGRSGKVLSLNQSEFGDEQINSSVSVVLNQSIQAAALRLARDLTAPGQAGQADDDLSDQDYYQDSPGKRLKPAS